MHGYSRGRLRALLVTTAMAAGGLALVSGAPVAEAQENGCPSVGTNFADEGPYGVTTEEDSVTTFYTPAELGSQGCATHPVIIWGNGTLTTPVVYDGLLRHWASHGFIVAAANTSNAGSGEEMLQGIDTLEAANGDSGSRFNGRVDLDNIGSSGHSQGAAGAVRAAADPRVSTTFPINGPGNVDNIDSALFLSGETDAFAAGMTSGFESSSQPAALVELAGAGHLVALGDAGGYRGPSTAWARWMLMGDADGAAQFQGDGCGLCGAGDLSDFRANAQLQELAGGSGGDGDGGEEPPPDPGGEPPAEEDCSFLAQIFGLCGDSGSGDGEEDCSFLAGILGLCGDSGSGGDGGDEPLPGGEPPAEEDCSFLAQIFGFC